MIEDQALESFVAGALNGLTLISILALGLAIVFGLMRILYLAHGESLAIGAYTLVSVERLGGSFWVALLLAPVVGAGLGVIIERLLIRRHHDNVIAVVLSTWGLSLILQQSLQFFFGSTPCSVTTPIPGVILIAGVKYPA